MTTEEIQKEIDALSQEQMAMLWRWAPSGHRYFDTEQPYFEIFKKRFNELGGMTPAVSKAIGWER